MKMGKCERKWVLGMALAPKLQARQGAQLAMTPQLQQAIKLLQLSNIELSAFVEEQLEKNPLLERGTGDENRRGEATEIVAKDVQTSADTISTAAAVSDMDTPDHALAPESTAADVGGSVDWSRNNSNGSFSGSGEYDPLANSAADITLSEHIQGQLPLLKFSDNDRLIADYLAGQVDEGGYLRMSAEEASENLGVGSARISSVLLQLQTLEPTGLFATSLSECLAMQMREIGRLDGPMQILLDNLVLLAKHDLSQLAKLCGVKIDALKEMISVLRKLSPKPGQAYGGTTVSRVTSGKYMHTPRGLFELKFFFTAAIPSLDGGEGHSSEAVRHKIKILISEETAKTIVSDDKIVGLLRAQGIDIARRTVAKYREALGIPSSVERRRIFKHA